MQLFPDIFLFDGVFTQIIKSSDESLPHGKITFLSDLSNGSSSFTGLANSVILGENEAVYNIEGDLNVDLSLETVSGDGDFIKEGAGSLSFRGGNTGSTLVSQGQLNLVAGSDLDDLTTVLVDSGAVLNVAVSDVVGSIAGQGDIQLSAAAALSAGSNNSSTTFTGAISGEGSLIKQGAGTLELSGTKPRPIQVEQVLMQVL